MSDDITSLLQFLKTPTPKAWLQQAQSNLSLLLIDHAHCERKAAITALNLMGKYPERTDLVALMSPLAREELLHFEKVLAILKKRKIRFVALTPSAYAVTLHQQASKKGDLSRLQDELIIGAIIEARSCERFMALIPYLGDLELEKFYHALVKSEARHFENYLELAQKMGECQSRIDFFVALENQLITSPSPIFRFHSGIMETH